MNRKPAKAARPATTPGKKSRRGRGRPRINQDIVGREAIVAAARQLMEEGPPHLATISSIARQAGVDPALVRYYFKNRDQLLLAVIEDILSSWRLTHSPKATEPAARLGQEVGNMLDFALNVRSMQRLMIDECANSRSAEVRQRVRGINAVVVDSMALLLHPDSRDPGEATDALFLFVALVGLSEFFAAAQQMILPLAPEGLGAEELAARYKKFITRLVLDGMRSRVEPWSVRKP